MKKIFTLLTAAAFALTMQAAAPQILFNGAETDASTTYETGYELSSQTQEIPGVGSFTFYSSKQDSHLSLKGDASAEVKVEVSATADVQFCGIDGNCTAGTSLNKTRVLGQAKPVEVTGNTAVAPLEIDVVKSQMSPIDASMLDNITVTVTAYYTSSPSEKAVCKVVLTNRPASEFGGIGAVANDTKLTYSGNSLHYTVAAPTKLALYSITGQLVMSRLINATGSVSLDSLHPGVYIYTAGRNTGKIVVRK